MLFVNIGRPLTNLQLVASIDVENNTISLFLFPGGRIIFIIAARRGSSGTQSAQRTTKFTREEAGLPLCSSCARRVRRAPQNFKHNYKEFLEILFFRPMHKTLQPPKKI